MEDENLSSFEKVIDACPDVCALFGDGVCFSPPDYAHFFYFPPPPGSNRTESAIFIQHQSNYPSCFDYWRNASSELDSKKFIGLSQIWLLLVGGIFAIITKCKPITKVWVPYCFHTKQLRFYTNSLQPYHPI